MIVLKILHTVTLAAEYVCWRAPRANGPAPVRALLLRGGQKVIQTHAQEGEEVCVQKGTAEGEKERQCFRDKAQRVGGEGGCSATNLLGGTTTTSKHNNSQKNTRGGRVGVKATLLLLLLRCRPTLLLLLHTNPITPTHYSLTTRAAPTRSS